MVKFMSVGAASVAAVGVCLTAAWTLRPGVGAQVPVMITSSAGRAVADDARSAVVKGVAGNWQGTLKATPQVELRITLDVARGKDGVLSGTWGSPDEAIEGLPLSSIALKDGVLAFATKHGVTYKGKMNREETEVVGEWTQLGKAYPLKFKRFDPSRVVAVAIPKELEGIWEGKLKVNGLIEIRLALRVEKGKDGA